MMHFLHNDWREKRLLNMAPDGPEQRSALPPSPEAQDAPDAQVDEQTLSPENLQVLANAKLTQFKDVRDKAKAALQELSDKYIKILPADQQKTYMQALQNALNAKTPFFIDRDGHVAERVDSLTIKADASRMVEQVVRTMENKGVSANAIKQSLDNNIYKLSDEMLRTVINTADKIPGDKMLQFVSVMTEIQAASSIAPPSKLLVALFVMNTANETERKDKVEQATGLKFDTEKYQALSVLFAEAGPILPYINAIASDAVKEVRSELETKADAQKILDDYDTNFDKEYAKETAVAALQALGATPDSIEAALGPPSDPEKLKYAEDPDSIEAKMNRIMGTINTLMIYISRIMEGLGGAKKDKNGNVPEPGSERGKLKKEIDDFNDEATNKGTIELKRVDGMDGDKKVVSEDLIITPKDLNTVKASLAGANLSPADGAPGTGTLIIKGVKSKTIRDVMNLLKADPVVEKPDDEKSKATETFKAKGEKILTDNSAAKQPDGTYQIDIGNEKPYLRFQGGKWEYTDTAATKSQDQWKPIPKDQWIATGGTWKTLAEGLAGSAEDVDLAKTRYERMKTIIEKNPSFTPEGIDTWHFDVTGSMDELYVKFDKATNKWMATDNSWGFGGLNAWQNPDLYNWPNAADAQSVVEQLRQINADKEDFA